MGQGEAGWGGAGRWPRQGGAGEVGRWVLVITGEATLVP